MAKFTKRKNSDFDRKVSVFLGDESLGDIDVTFKKIEQKLLDDLLDEGEVKLLKQVVQRVGDIEDEETKEMITGQNAIDLVLEDVNCSAALVGDYLEAMKTKNFRNAGSRKRR